MTRRVKRQYSSLILYHSDVQKRAAMESIEEERVNRVPEIIITEIAEAGPFYNAEELVLPQRSNYFSKHGNIFKKLCLF